MKFCRRLCKEVSKLINTPSFTNPLSKLVCQLSMLINGKTQYQQDLSQLEEKSKLGFLMTWDKFHSMLSSAQNNRICLVTYSEWNAIMTLKGFDQEICFDSVEIKEILMTAGFADEIAKEMLVRFFTKLMYKVNQIYSYVVLFEKILKDFTFCQKIINLKDFLTMAFDPSLYSNYNHHRGKFATECCQKCKVCRSATVPEDFTDRLTKARKNLLKSYETFGELGFDFTKPLKTMSVAI